TACESERRIDWVCERTAKLSRIVVRASERPSHDPPGIFAKLRSRLHKNVFIQRGRASDRRGVGINAHLLFTNLRIIRLLGIWLSSLPAKALPAAHFDLNEKYAYFADRTLMRHVILDTDIGTDVDDLLALVFLAHARELCLEGVTTVYGDTLLRARIAAAV